MRGGVGGFHDFRACASWGALMGRCRLSGVSGFQVCVGSRTLWGMRLGGVWRHGFAVADILGGVRLIVHIRSLRISEVCQVSVGP